MDTSKLRKPNTSRHLLVRIFPNHNIQSELLSGGSFNAATESSHTWAEAIKRWYLHRRVENSLFHPLLFCCCCCYCCFYFLMWTIFKVFIESATILPLFMFWLFGCETCKILAPQPGIKLIPTRPPHPHLHCIRRQSLNHRIAREDPISSLIGSYCLHICLLSLPKHTHTS